MQPDGRSLAPDPALSVRQNHERLGIRSVAEAKASLRRFGWELTGPAGSVLPWRLRRLPQPEEIDCLAVASLPGVYAVDLGNVVSATGFSFGPAGWDPLVATLQQYRADPSLRYPGSMLADLYAAYRPLTVHDALFHDIRESLPPFDRLPARWLGRVWTLGPRQVRLARSTDLRDVAPTSSLGHPYFGPRSDSQGRWHFERTVRIFESVRRHGYRPELHSGGDLRGYFLVGDQRWRFVIVDGHHRLAALMALGATTVPVRLWGGPSVIMGDDLDRWATAHGGPYPREVAARLFERLLYSDGARKAADLGLAPSR